MGDDNLNSRRKHHHRSPEPEAEESTKRRKHRHHHRHHHRSSRKHRDSEKDKVKPEEPCHSALLPPPLPVRQPEVLAPVSEHDVTLPRLAVRVDYDMEEGEIIEDDEMYQETEIAFWKTEGAENPESDKLEAGEAFDKSGLQKQEAQCVGVKLHPDSHMNHGFERTEQIENINEINDTCLAENKVSQNINMDGATGKSSYHEPGALLNHHATSCTNDREGHLSSDFNDGDLEDVAVLLPHSLVESDSKHKTHSSSESMDQDFKRHHIEHKSGSLHRSGDRSRSHSLLEESASLVSAEVEAFDVDSKEVKNELSDERIGRHIKHHTYRRNDLIERENEHFTRYGKYCDDRDRQRSHEIRGLDIREKEVDREWERDKMSVEIRYKDVRTDRKSRERDRFRSRDWRREVYHDRECWEQRDHSREDHINWNLEDERDQIRDRSKDKCKNSHREQYRSASSMEEEHEVTVHGRNLEKAEERDKHREKERNAHRRREREMDVDRIREKERYGDKFMERERDRDKFRERERDRDMDRGRERDYDMARERKRDRDVVRERERGSNTDKERIADRNHMNWNRKYDDIDGAKYSSMHLKQDEADKFRKRHIVNGTGANNLSIHRGDYDESNDYGQDVEEREVLTIEDQEEEDVNRIKEESKRIREAILKKYKTQSARQEATPSKGYRGDDAGKHLVGQPVGRSGVIGNVLPEDLYEKGDATEFSVTEFSVTKSPVQNGTLDVQRPYGTSGLGEGTPKSEMTDMFRDDIFGESPEGVRKSGKGDGLPLERSGLYDNWDDAEGYYSYRFGELLDGRYEVTAAHGKGVFSTVVRAKDLKAGSGDLNEVAIKIIRNNETMYKAGMQELVILKKLVGADPENRRHCVRFVSHFKYRNHLCLVFESLHMNLREVLKKFGRNIGLKLTAVRAYSKQLFIALKHLRNCGVLHCDIKPDNMVVNEAKNVLKLCDFGNAMFAGKNEITPYLVSRFYRAPEIILGLPYDHPLDIWSVGCCIYELYTGKVLFPGPSNNDMLRLHMELKGTFPKKMLRKGAFTEQHFDQDLNFHATEEDPVTKKSIKRLVLNIKQKDISSLIPYSSGEDPKMLANFRDLLDKIFVLDPEKRMTISQALNHPFITGK